MISLKFNGSGLEYFKIWIVNISLIVVTFGLYYPWAKVRNRRYLYANTIFEDRNFEYHATGKQLFLSYLIAMGCLITYLITNSFSPTGATALLVLFMIALPWIIWSSLKFNARMTSFSNVRFSFAGSLKDSYIILLGIPLCGFLLLGAVGFLGIKVLEQGSGQLGAISIILLGIVTLLVLIGALYLNALIAKKMNSYYINGYRYGQGEFAAKLSVSKFFKIHFTAIVFSITGFLLLIVIAAVVMFLTGGADQLLAMQGGLENPEEIAAELPAGIFGVIFSIYLGMIILSMLVAGYVFTRQRTYIFSNLTLDEATYFSSTLTTRIYTWVMITNLLIIAFTLGLGIPWAKVRMLRTVLQNTSIEPNTDINSYITQQQKEQSSLAEQLGDAFDVDLGVGI